MNDRPVKRLPLPPQMRWRLSRLDLAIQAAERERSALIEGFVLAHNIEPGFTVAVTDEAVEVVEKGETNGSSNDCPISRAS